MEELGLIPYFYGKQFYHTIFSAWVASFWCLYSVITLRNHHHYYHHFELENCNLCSQSARVRLKERDRKYWQISFLLFVVKIFRARPFFMKISSKTGCGSSDFRPANILILHNLVWKFP